MVPTCRCNDLKEKRQRHIFFDEGKGTSFPPMDGCLSVGGGHHTNPNVVPRKTISSPAALGSTSRSSAALVDASCARPMDRQLDPTMPDFIVIYCSSLVRDYTSEPRCTISCWIGKGIRRLILLEGWGGRRFIQISRINVNLWAGSTCYWCQARELRSRYWEGGRGGASLNVVKPVH